MSKRPRVKRPLEFKVDALCFYLNGDSPAKALERACDKHNLPLSGCMTKYASSYMSDDIKQFVLNKYKRGCATAIELVESHPIILEKLL